jgi:hypothetical protein
MDGQLGQFEQRPTDQQQDCQSFSHEHLLRRNEAGDKPPVQFSYGDFGVALQAGVVPFKVTLNYSNRFELFKVRDFEWPANEQHSLVA